MIQASNMSRYIFVSVAFQTAAQFSCFESETMRERERRWEFTRCITRLQCIWDFALGRSVQWGISSVHWEDLIIVMQHPKCTDDIPQAQIMKAPQCIDDIPTQKS